ncbi:MAG: glycosyltransferase [Anaeromyxobacter sp.]
MSPTIPPLIDGTSSAWRTPRPTCCCRGAPTRPPRWRSCTSTVASRARAPGLLLPSRPRSCSAEPCRATEVWSSSSGPSSSCETCRPSSGFCGKGHNELVGRAVARDSRIRFFGLVPEAELERLAGLATAFLNPRPPELTASAHNFPSKVLEYLSYGHPVVSTWTPGLSPEYRDVLVLTDARAEDLALRMREVVAWDEGTRASYRSRAQAFLASRTWTAQAQRLATFLTEVVNR